jgi:hypothetical protein
MKRNNPILIMYAAFSNDDITPDVVKRIDKERKHVCICGMKMDKHWKFCPFCGRRI